MKKLTKKEIELLQALYDVIGIEAGLLNNKGLRKFNELADRADAQNLVW